MSTELKRIARGKVAVFIDAANLELSAKDRDWKVDYRKLYKWLKIIERKPQKSPSFSTGG